MIRYSRLIDSGQIEQGNFSTEQVADRLKIAHRDLKASAKMLESVHEWAYTIAYNAMLQAGRALMFAEGFRAKGDGQHFTTVQFLRDTFGPEEKDFLDVMDRMRRKRNRSVYDTVGAISAKEAQEALQAAKEFVARIEKELDDRKQGS